MNMRKWFLWPVDKYTEMITRNKELKCLQKKKKKKNLFKLEAAKHTTKKMGFKDLGELHFYNLLGTEIGAEFPL